MNWTLDPTIPSGIWWQLSRLGRRTHRLGETYQNTVSTALCVLDRSQSLLLVSVAVWYQAAPGGSQRPVWWPEYWTPAAPTADHSLSILYLQKQIFQLFHFINSDCEEKDFQKSKLKITVWPRAERRDA